VGLGSLELGSGVAGFATYFKGGILIVVIGGVLWSVWRWARQRRSGDPRFM
jgi:hypothetical protein